MQAQATAVQGRTEAQQIQTRRLQLNTARGDLARFTRHLYRASDRADRSGTRRYAELVAKAKADIRDAQEQLADLGALL